MKQIIPKVKYEPLERQITHSIIEYLNYQGFYVWKSNTGAMELPNKNGTSRLVRFGKAGMSDIIGLQRGTGRFVALEVKRPSTRNRTTTAQDSFLALVKEYGGIAGVVTSIDDVKEKLKEKSWISICATREL